MTDTKISSSMDLRSLQNFVEEIIGGVDFRLSLKMERVLAKAFGYTQDRTHVISGSLKASGKTMSDHDGDHWEGEIEYGGILVGSASPGPPKDPVEYAIYEAARGPEHDPLHGLEVFEAMYEDAINEYLGEISK